MKRQDTFIQADSMGMGKTAQAIEYMHQTTNNRFIVVCPCSLKSNWRYEINQWLGIDVEPDAYTGDIIITNYERVKHMIDLLGSCVHNYKGVILDEAHMVKNLYANRTQITKQLIDLVGNPMLLTGTPILNKPNDLLGLLYVGGKIELFGGIEAYKKRYIPTLEKGNAIYYSNVSHLDELHKKLETMICRRRWCDIRKPTFEVNEEEVSLGTFADYPIGSVRIEDMQRVEMKVMERKIPLVARWIRKDYQENHLPLVVFANHRYMLEALHNTFDNSVLLYGGMTDVQKEESINKFNNCSSDIIFCSINCTACGLNLSRSNRVVFAEFPWNKGIYQQAIARCARLGQFSNVTNVFALVMENSYDRYRLEQMHWKSIIANDIIDGEKKDGRYYTGNVSLGIYSYLEDGSIDTEQYHGIDVYSKHFAYALGEMCRDWILAHPMCDSPPNQYWDYLFRSYLQYKFATTHKCTLIGPSISVEEEELLQQRYSTLEPLSEMTNYTTIELDTRKLWFDKVWKQYEYPYNSWYTIYRQQIYVK